MGLLNDKWELIHILPNINIDAPFENEYIAIVNHEDSRIKEISKESPNLKKLLLSFHDQFSNTICPSILIISNKFKNSSEEAIVAFRNILAISIIVKGLEHRFTHTFQAFPLYSESFDFYPLTTSKTNEILYDSPSVQGFLGEISDFQGQCSPFIFKAQSLNVDSSCHLLSLLHGNWLKRYTTKSGKNWNTVKLFRSLEMAYQACSIPEKNKQSIYDHGVSACLWVSAFEILSHPLTGNSNKFKVSQLLGEYRWRIKSKVNNKSFYKLNNRGELSKGDPKINLIQRLYFELNNLRNDFLHGNEIKGSNKVQPFRKSKNKSFIYYAPLIYKIALISFLEKNNLSLNNSNLSIEEELLHHLNRSDYETPISEVFNSIKR